MSELDPPACAPGRNFAFKVPAWLHDDAAAFYRDIVGLPRADTDGTSQVFEFGEMRLWLDRADHATHSDVWLELQVDDVERSALRLERAGARIADHLEGRAASLTTASVRRVHPVQPATTKAATT